MKSTVMERTVANVIETVLDEAEDGVIVVAPDAETIEGLVRVIDDESPSIRLLAEPTTLKSVMDEFLVAGRTANHVESGVLEIRQYGEGTNALSITADAVVAIVRTDDLVAGLSTDDEAFVDSANETFSSAWNRAERYDLRTPPLRRVRETLESELGSRTVEDFDSVLSAIETARGDAGLDEVTISLLVAARNERLLYDISKWGEDVGIASKATFSRTKTRLEESGVIETEKVPIDVGRPRLRLKLADDRLEGVDDEEFVRLVGSMLSD